MSDSNNIVFLGEAMLELATLTPKTLNKSFAGDVLNTAIYLKRVFPQFDSQFMSAIGGDPMSKELVNLLNAENISDTLLGVSDTRHLGAYMVVNDDTGERSFIYWRSQSAAKQMMTTANEKQLDEVRNAKVVFFSGISLAILELEQRPAFWELIKQARKNGCTVVFDPNYRPALWQSEADAKAQMETAFQNSDWLLPGVDDFETLYGIDTVEGCVDFCKTYDFAEIIVKQGSKSVHVVHDGQIEEVKVTPSDSVVDTTSAGDAFNAGYLGARLSGKSVELAVKTGSAIAKEVIAHKGAIVDQAVFASHLETLKDELGL